MVVAEGRVVGTVNTQHPSTWKSVCETLEFEGLVVEKVYSSVQGLVRIMDQCSK